MEDGCCATPSPRRGEGNHEDSVGRGQGAPKGLGDGDVRGLKTLRAFHNIEFDRRSLLQ